MFLDVRPRKWKMDLCQNCVTYPPETLVTSISYGDVATQIVVAEVVDPKVCWKDLVCVSTRGRSRFPSVLLQPLGHLSALESTICSTHQQSNRELWNTSSCVAITDGRFPV